MHIHFQPVVKTFADAKNAPTSFEDEQWLEGFEFARRFIATHLAESLEKAGMIESASEFLDACGISEMESSE